MKRFPKPPEPESWDARCRQRGRKWLKEHSQYDRPRDYWTEFEPDLRNAFSGLCAYCVMRVLSGDMDHFLPITRLKRIGREELAYEWDNFRYADGVINQKKSDHEVLGPFIVKDDWFEILLPSLQLQMTEKIPKKYREIAKFTLDRLGLQESEVVVRFRAEWFRMYREGKITLEGLRDVAPLIARAVEKDVQGGKTWLLP